jgi:Ni,Fe-hydrogenase III small subunit/ferredoxin
MALPWALRGLRNGVLTSHYPRRTDPYFEEFPATVEVRHGHGTAEAIGALGSEATLDALCPTGALIAVDGLGSAIAVDRGTCIGCGRCVEAHPDVFAWRLGADTTALTRHGLVARTGLGSQREVEKVRSELAGRVRALRRSVHIRHIDLGSDGSDEWEIQALVNPVYDIHRLGIFFTASPRHADILMVTGIGAPAMRAPLQRTREAMPDPVVVIAVGTDAVSGGLFNRGYATSGGVGDLVDVDVWVPGSPPSPFSILHGILLALDRLPSHRDASSRGPRAGKSVPGREAGRNSGPSGGGEA